MWFPTETVTGTKQNGVWEIDTPEYNDGRVLEWISLQGPASSAVTVYINTTFIDTTPRGDNNRADYPNGIPIPRGCVIRLVWNVGTGSAPVASFGMTDGNPRLVNDPFA